MIIGGRGGKVASTGLSSLWRNEAGRASWRGVLALFLVAAVVYVGFKVIPVRTAAYQFEDALRDEVVLAASRRGRGSDESIRRSLLETAAELRLPVEHSQIVIRHPGRRYIVIEADYTVDVEFIGGYVYTWRFTPTAEGPVIF
jgi:hypothetical protein